MFKVRWAEKPCQLGLPRSRCQGGFKSSKDLLRAVSIEDEGVREQGQWGKISGHDAVKGLTP